MAGCRVARRTRLLQQLLAPLPSARLGREEKNIRRGHDRGRGIEAAQLVFRDKGCTTPHQTERLIDLPEVQPTASQFAKAAGKSAIVRYLFIDLAGFIELLGCRDEVALEKLLVAATRPRPGLAVRILHLGKQLQDLAVQSDPALVAAVAQHY